MCLKIILFFLVVSILHTDCGTAKNLIDDASPSNLSTGNRSKKDNSNDHFEDIIVLDQTGRLKSMKYKSAKRKPVSFKNGDVTKYDKKVTNLVVTDSSGDQLKLALIKSKFFDEIGRKCK
ncbi:hypothetical protein EVAR_61258_1 [Eumeta japonica]|uniref:Uncharacterized protein n=1 Tax=Eumeta variegata TaxID=151549 RepID=A0A4C1Z257_EUMVA|nr:hypothetical protein EVAR_61258_1 [Eumeta japonica]